MKFHYAFCVNDTPAAFFKDCEKGEISAGRAIKRCQQLASCCYLVWAKVTTIGNEVSEEEVRQCIGI